MLGLMWISMGTFFYAENWENIRHFNENIFNLFALPTVLLSTDYSHNTLGTENKSVEIKISTFCKWVFGSKMLFI